MARETLVPPARETLIPEDSLVLPDEELAPGDAAPPADAPASLEPVPEAEQVVEIARPVGPDPFAAAEAALAKARAARGVRDDSPVSAPLRRASATDPFGAAEDALARAREARASTGVDQALGITPGTNRATQRDRALAEAKAAAELRRLKRERGDDEDEP